MNVEDQIRKCVDERRSFVLDAGAGAGKTYSLVSALKHATTVHAPKLRKCGQHIACITFTNAAKDEVIERIGSTSIVRVSTIHDFLWAVVRPHQKALRRAVQEVNSLLSATSRRRKDPDELKRVLPSVPITYSDTGSNFLEGRLFHDDLLAVASVLFRDNALLSRLVAAQFPIVLVDEYQDTDPKVVDILVGLVSRSKPGSVLVGLFGDKLQHIYDGGVGELPSHATDVLEVIAKGDNRRCSLAVVNVLNKLRTDIQQFPAHKNVAGEAVYVHVSDRTRSVDDIIHSIRLQLSWQEDGENSKVLYLTHRVLAREGGYGALLKAFVDRGQYYRDRFLKGEDTRISFCLDRLEPVAEAWRSRNTGHVLTLLRRHGFELASSAGKGAVASALDELECVRAEGTVRDVLEHVQRQKLLVLPDELRDGLVGRTSDPGRENAGTSDSEALDAQFYAAFLALPYSEVTAFAAYFHQNTPFSTKHGVKGAEFDSVYVILDDRGAAWRNYSFDKYLDGQDERARPERFRRTRNLFYVCCSRAKNHLCVIDLGEMSPKKSARVELVFGKDKCFYV